MSDAGSTDATAIAFSNDMSRSMYPMAHESWLSLPPASAAAVNWLLSARLDKYHGSPLIYPGQSSLDGFIPLVFGPVLQGLH
jgi:hypothetical protein